MGGEPYFYVVPYQADIDAALQVLRRREFEAGRYNPATPFQKFPVDPGAPGPGAEHASIEEAIAAAEADGTRSILDLFALSKRPDYGHVAPLAADIVEKLYGTREPTRKMVDADIAAGGGSGAFHDEIPDRGKGVYFLIYEDGEPSEILFAGYSYD